MFFGRYVSVSIGLICQNNRSLLRACVCMCVHVCVCVHVCMCVCVCVYARARACMTYVLVGDSMYDIRGCA